MRGAELRMVAASEDAVWLDVLPSMRNFGSELGKGAGVAAATQGKSVGKRFGKSALIGIGIVAAGAAVAGKALYEIGATFDKVEDTIRVGTGATGESLKSLTDSAKNVGKNVPAAFEDIGTVVADVNTRLGLTGPTLEKFSAQALEAGRIMGEEIDINALSGAFSAFKIEGKDTTKAMDGLFQVSQATGVGMNELAAITAESAPAMQTLGFSFEETAGLAGTLDKAGLNSSKTMNGMSKALVELARDGEEPQEAFKRTTEEMQGFIDKGDDAAALDLAADLFGTRNATQFIGALQSGKVNMDDLGNVAGMTGDTILEAAKDTQSFGEKWQIVKNRALLAVAPVADRVFGAMADGADMLLDKVIPAAEKFVGQWQKGVGIGGKFSAVFGEIAGSVKAFAAAWKYNDGEVTSSGLPGFMERVGYAARQTFGYVKDTVLPAIGSLVKSLWRNKEILIAVGGAVLAGVVAFKAFMFIKKVITVVKAARAAMLAFNATMLANPIFLVVALIGVLVGALVYLYRNNEKARRIMDAAWAAIKSAISSVVGWFKNTAWPMLKSVFSAIGSIAKWLWGQMKTVFNGIKTVISWWYRNIVKRYFALVTGIFKALSATAKWLWGKIKAAFNGISIVASWLWGKLKAAFRRITNGVKGVAKIAKWLYTNGIRPAFNNIKDKAFWLWDKVKWAFDKLKDGASKVKDAFVKVKDGIKDQFGKIVGAIKSPIKKALGWLQRNLIDKVNGMLKGIKVDFRVPSIPGAKGWSAGGWTGPGSKMTPAGVVHADEYVVNKKARGRFERGNPGVLDHINRTGRLPGYAAGGYVYPALSRWIQNKVPGSVITSTKRNWGGTSYHEQGKAIDIGGSAGIMRQVAQAIKSHFGDKITELIHNPGFSVKNGQSQPSSFWGGSTWGAHRDHVHWAMKSMTGAGGALGGGQDGNWFSKKFDKLTGKFDPSKFGLAGEVLPAVFKSVKGAVKGKVQDAFDSFVPDGLKGGDLSGVERWRGVARTALKMEGQPVSLMHSLLRRMDQESSGNPKAINLSDINAMRGDPSKGLMQVIGSTFRAYARPGYNSNVYDPLSNILASIRYTKARYGSLSQGWGRKGGYDEGGLVKPFVADSGVTLAPGLNLLNNKLGKPEPLQRPEHAMAPNVRVFIGTEELTNIVRTEIDYDHAFAGATGRMH